jgi:glycosyltransferase involved in cell wall biosynthesis
MKIDTAQTIDAAPSPPRRLKIAVLNRVFAATGGGAERYSIAVVEQLAATHDIHVFAQKIDHQWPQVHYHRIACFSPKPRWLNQLWYAFATWRATRRGFDIVHSHENVWHAHVQTIHVKTVKRSVLDDVHGIKKILRWLKILTSPRLITYLALEAQRMAPRLGVAVVAVSQMLESELVAQYPQSQAAMRVITPGVSVPTITVSQAHARQQLGVAAQGHYALFVANDYARKGLDCLLQALKEMPDVQLLVVGHPGQTARFTALAQTLGIEKRVHFLGTLQNMTIAYYAADVLVHPTLEDSFAMVVIEAMAHQLPVVVSAKRYCGISAMLSDGANAVLLDDPTDSGALKEKLLRLLDDEQFKKQIATQGLEFSQLHSWQHVAQRYARLYLELV